MLSERTRVKRVRTLGVGRPRHDVSYDEFSQANIAGATRRTVRIRRRILFFSVLVLRAFVPGRPRRARNYAFNIDDRLGNFLLIGDLFIFALNFVQIETASGPASEVVIDITVRVIGLPYRFFQKNLVRDRSADIATIFFALFLDNVVIFARLFLPGIPAVQRFGKYKNMRLAGSVL